MAIRQKCKIIAILSQYREFSTALESPMTLADRMSRTKRRRQQKKLQPRPPNLDGTTEIVELKKWMSSKGWQNETGLQLRDFETTGRGVCSKQLVSPSQVLIEVPYDLMITWTTLQRSELACVAEGLKMQDVLALFLALELHKGVRSEWAKYLGSLPKEVPGLPWLCGCFMEGHGKCEDGKDKTSILGRKFEQSLDLEDRQSQERTSVSKFGMVQEKTSGVQFGMGATSDQDNISVPELGIGATQEQEKDGVPQSRMGTTQLQEKTSVVQFEMDATSAQENIGLPESGIAAIQAQESINVPEFRMGATSVQESSGRHFDEHQKMSCKCPDFLRGKITSLRSDYELSCRRVRKSIRHKKCLCCGVGLDRVITENLYTWGYTMVNTRSVYVDPNIVRSTTPEPCPLADEPSMALCPYLDMFNHSHLATTDAQLVYTGGKWVYQLKSGQPYKKYQQIYISYGPHDNTKLLLEYGFFIPGNTFDSITFTFDVVVRHLSKQGLQLSPRQYKYLKSKSLDSNLHVTNLALSFNLKALYHVSFEDSGNWNALIYTDAYSNNDLIRMLSLTRSLLLEEYPTICKGPHCPSLVSYLDYQTEYRREVLRYLEDEISIDRNRFA